MSNFISEFLNTATETDISPEWLINKIGNNNSVTQREKRATSLQFIYIIQYKKQ